MKNTIILFLFTLTSCIEEYDMSKCWAWNRPDSYNDVCEKVLVEADIIYQGCEKHHQELFCTFSKKDFICSEFGGHPCSCDPNEKGIMNECISIYNFLGHKGVVICEQIIESCQ